MCDPDRMIARGLGVVVGIKERDDEIKDMLLTDICPFSLGVGVRNHDGSDRDMMSILIELPMTIRQRLSSMSIRGKITTQMTICLSDRSNFMFLQKGRERFILISGLPTISMVFWKYSYIRRRPVRDRR